MITNNDTIYLFGEVDAIYISVCTPIEYCSSGSFGCEIIQINISKRRISLGLTSTIELSALNPEYGELGVAANYTGGEYGISSQINFICAHQSHVSF